MRPIDWSRRSSVYHILEHLAAVADSRTAHTGMANRFGEAIDNGWIKVAGNGRQVYVITDKGREALRLHLEGAQAEAA